MTILVVDDDKRIQLLYQSELEEEGYEVHIASSGIEALEKLDTVKPDLVTLDVLMPDMDGIQVLRKMKEKNPQLPIIMSTAYDYHDDFAIWASEDYVVKSSDLSELKGTIRKLIGPSQSS